jgi:threonine/homoserine/homoserine lactone efflux protein
MFSLAMLPSTSVGLVVAYGMSSGIKSAVYAIAGIVCADIVFIILAISGLTLLHEMLGGFFVLLKYIAALYIIWFGVGLLYKKSVRDNTHHFQHMSQGASYKSFLAGFLVTLGDLKAILFYGSLLPFFVSVESLKLLDVFYILMATIVSIASAKLIYLYISKKVLKKIKSNNFHRLPNKLAGGFMIGAGGWLALKG